MAQDWNIQPRSERCLKCETPFADRQNYYCALVYGNEGYARRDFCETCWGEEIENISPYSTWQGVFKMPPPEPEEPLKQETAESLLRKCMEDVDNSKINVVYILAVMLERKRMLVERDVQTSDEGETTRIYEHRNTGETFVIPDPHLKLDQLEETQEEVARMLGDGQGGQDAEDSDKKRQNN